MQNRDITDLLKLALPKLEILLPNIVHKFIYFLWV